MVDLPADLYKPAATVLFGALCAALGIIGYFLRDIRQSMRERLGQQDEKIEAVEDSLNALKEKLPQKYVLRDDFIRAIAGLENKIDTIGKEISDINKYLNRLIGGAKE